jgi:hypothetical protein
MSKYSKCEICGQYGEYRYRNTINSINVIENNNKYYTCLCNQISIRTQNINDCVQTTLRMSTKSNCLDNYLRYIDSNLTIYYNNKIINLICFGDKNTNYTRNFKINIIIKKDYTIIDKNILNTIKDLNYNYKESENEYNILHIKYTKLQKEFDNTNNKLEKLTYLNKSLINALMVYKYTDIQSYNYKEIENRKKELHKEFKYVLKFMKFNNNI